MKDSRKMFFLKDCINLIVFRELVAELPFTLMHPKPEEDRPSSSSGSHKSETSAKENGEEKSAVAEASSKPPVDPMVDTNLIQLDT